MSRKLVTWLYSPDYPAWCIPDASLSQLGEALGAGWDVVPMREPMWAGGDGSRTVPDSVRHEMREAEVYVGFGISRELFMAAENLRWVHSAAAGARASLFPEMVASDVLFTNSAGIHAEPLAEWTLAAMLYFARGFDIAMRAKYEHVWRYEPLAGRTSPLRELASSTVGIIGFGGIGSAVGRKAKALGMRVIALRRNPEVDMDADGTTPGPGVPADETLGPGELPRLLDAADYVVISAPETRETTNLIGPAELARMRPGSVLINLSRGAIVDEDALVDALRSGRLRGAALDVFRREPLPHDSPLWGMEHVLLTPHTGSITPAFWERETSLILENVRRYLAGEPLENAVNKSGGY